MHSVGASRKVKRRLSAFRPRPPALLPPHAVSWRSVRLVKSARGILTICGRALAFVEQRRAAPGTEASGGPRLRVFEAGDASLAFRHAGVLAPTADIGRVGGAVRATACCGVIVPGPKGRKVDVQL